MDDLAVLSNHLADARIILHNIEDVASDIGFYINVKKQNSSGVTNTTLELSNHPAVMTSNFLKSLTAT